MNPSHHGPPQPVLIQRPRGGRPHLLRFNRKLRHLRGISFRNLAFSDPVKRARGQTIDDDAVPYTLSSPAKLLALNENHTLAHSRSSDNLARDHDLICAPKDQGRHETNGHAVTPVRKTQRRNTAEWLSATPKQRHKRFEEALARHTGDVFFSVHIHGQDDPLYVSEIAEGGMNHDFRYFDLTSYGSETTSRDQCEFKFWGRHNKNSTWRHLIDLPVNFRSLTYVGRTLDEFHYYLPDNFVFIHLSDGIYAPADSIQSTDEDGVLPATMQSVSKALPSAEPTSSYDALMRLSTLDTCTQDALTNHAKLTKEIASLIVDNNGHLSQPTTLTLVHDQHSSVERTLATTRKQITSLKTDLAHSRQSLSLRRNTTTSGQETHRRSRDTCSSRRTELSDRRTHHTATLDIIHGQRRRLATEVQTIYPIEPLKHHAANPLSFTIRNLYLPNSNFSSPQLSAAAVSAALGHAAHSTHLLSLYLTIPLPYPISPRSSTSTVNDSISILPPSQSRTFPLYLTPRGDNLASASGSAAFGRFEYAVFLLNKDIEAIAARLGIRVLDIRQTLPNLKYVFLVASAGKGEVPRRMAGGIRALMLGRSVGASAESSRRGSEDSASGEAGKAAEEVRRKLAMTRLETSAGKGKERA